MDNAKAKVGKATDVVANAQNQVKTNAHGETSWTTQVEPTTEKPTTSTSG